MCEFEGKPMIATGVDTRRCIDCGKEQPLTEYRRRGRGSHLRFNQCRSCHNEAENRRRAKRKVEHEHAEIAQFARHVKNAKTYHTVESLCAQMVARFDGIDQFNERWFQQIEATKPGTKKKLDSFLAIHNLIVQCSSHQTDGGERGEYELLTDEDLERRMDSYVEEFINEQPELAIAAAARIGWTIIPPQSK